MSNIWFLNKSFFFKGLNKPVFLKFFSIILEILLPNSLTFNSSSSLDLISTCKGETAIGKGSKFPLVISTSIKCFRILELIKKYSLK